MTYLGIDLHKQFSFVTALNGEGEIVFQNRVNNHSEQYRSLIEHFGDPGNIKAVIEATCTYRWLYKLLTASGIKVILAHPSRLKAIASARIKTDKIDSTILAKLMRADMIPEAYIPNEEEQKLREFLRFRTSLVQQRTKLKNKIHAILLKLNLKCKYQDVFGKGGRHWLETLDLSVQDRMFVDQYLELIDVFNAKISDCDKEIDKLAKQSQGAKLLETIPGVASKTAMLILAEIGKVDRFSGPKQLCSYAGLVPSTQASGGKTYHGSITKAGNPWLRWAMVEAVSHAVRKNANLKSKYQRLVKRKNKNKARVAIARRILTGVYYMLTKNESFDPR